MQKIKTNSTQVTNFLNTNTNSLINVYDLNKNKLINKYMLSIFSKKQEVLPDNKAQNKQKNNNKNRLFKLLSIILFIFLSYCLIKYNILYNCWIFINNNLKLFYSLIYYLLIFNLIFTVIYHSIGYFILCIDNEIKIDLNKIKIKFIRNLLEGLLVIQRTCIDKEEMKKLFLIPLFVCLLSVIVSGLLILM
jgi:hypothetical protein